MLGKGYVHVYTGNGKGKSTAMLGLTLRAAGAGHKTYIGQFVKSMAYSEVALIKANLPMIHIEQYGPGCLLQRKATPEDAEITKRGLEKTIAAIPSFK